MQRRAALLVVAAVALPALGDHAPQQRANRELDGWAIASFDLIDQHGRPLTQQHLRGRWTFLLFGDTTGCAQRCGTALSALAGVSKRIARADIARTTQMLFITLDPEHDTPARLRDYLAAFDTRFIGASGAPSVLRRLADDFGVDREHPGSLLLVGPDATVRAEYLPPFDVPRLTAAYVRARHGRY